MSNESFGVGKGSSSTPVGSLITGILEGNTDYVPTNGQIVQRIDYPALYTALGTIPHASFQVQAVSPFGTTEALDIASNDSSLFVAIAGGGQIATSSNGTSWTLAGTTIPSAYVISYVANNSTFYITTTTGQIWSSTNGTSWTLRSTFTNKKLGRVIYGSGGYFVTSKDGNVYFSTSGTSFSLGFSDATTDTTDAVWDGSNLYYLVYYSGANIYMRWKLSWSGSALTAAGVDPAINTNITGFGSSTYPSNLVYFSGKYVVWAKSSTTSMRPLYSTDLISWSSSSVPNSGGYNNYGKLSVGGATLVATMYSTTTAYIYTTTDGVTYSSKSNPFYVNGDLTNSRMNGTAYMTVGTTWAMVGGGGKVASGDISATTWTLQTSPFTASSSNIGNNVASNGSDVFVIVGDAGTVAQSPTGSSWSAVPSGTVNNLMTVGYGSGKWLIGGSGGVLKYSTDLVTFTGCTGSPAGTIHNVKYGNSVWVATSTTTPFLHKSSDGITFTNATTTSGATSGVSSGLAFGNNIFVHVGGGSIRYSYNGDTWAIAANPTSVSPTRVFFNGVYFLASTSSGASSMLRSINGVDWEEVTLSPSSKTLIGVSEGLFVGNNATSKDGINWFSGGQPSGTITSCIGLNGITTLTTTTAGVFWRGVTYDYDTTNQIFVPFIAGTPYNRYYYKAR